MVNLWLFVLLILLTGSGQAAVTQVVDGLAARIGSQAVLWSDVLEARDAARFDRGATETSLYTLREQLIEDHLVAEEAKRLQIAVSDEELQNTINQVATDNSLDRAGLERVIRAQGMTWEGYRDMVRSQMVKARLIQSEIQPSVVISDSDVDAAWSQYRRQYLSIEYHLQLAPPGEHETDDEVDLGWLAPEEARPEVREGITKALAGGGRALAIILDTKNWVLTLLEERLREPDDATTIREQLRQELQQSLLQTAFERWLAGLKNRRHIERTAIPAVLFDPLHH